MFKFEAGILKISIISQSQGFIFSMFTFSAYTALKSVRVCVYAA